MCKSLTSGRGEGALIESGNNSVVFIFLKEFETIKPTFICFFFSYVRYADLRSLPNMTEQTLIAIKAPLESRSTIEVSDPTETKVFYYVFCVVFVILMYFLNYRFKALGSELVHVLYFQRFEMLVRNENKEQLQAFLCPETDAGSASELSGDHAVCYSYRSCP